MKAQSAPPPKVEPKDAKDAKDATDTKDTKDTKDAKDIDETSRDLPRLGDVKVDAAKDAKDAKPDSKKDADR